PADAHHPGLRDNHEPRPMSRVLTSETLRHEDVHEFTNQLLTLVPEQLFDLTVHQDDVAPIVDEDDTTRRSFRRQTKFLLRLLAFRDVHQNAALPDRLAIVVELDAASPRDPANFAIG